MIEPKGNSDRTEDEDSDNRERTIKLSDKMSYFTEFLEKNGLRMEDNVPWTFEVRRLIADEYDRKARESENEKSSMETQIQTSKLQVEELKTE